MQAKWLATSFEGLNVSLAQLPGELWSCKDLANMGKLYLSKRKLPSSKSVNQAHTKIGSTVDPANKSTLGPADFRFSKRQFY